MSKVSTKVANLDERKNPHTPVYGVKEFVCKDYPLCSGELLSYLQWKVVYLKFLNEVFNQTLSIYPSA